MTLEPFVGAVKGAVHSSSNCPFVQMPPSPQRRNPSYILRDSHCLQILLSIKVLVNETQPERPHFDASLFNKSDAVL